jgi:hypothetical protein
VRRHRQKLRESGLRPIRLWVPDTRNPEFQKECRRQARLLKEDPEGGAMLAWSEELSDLTDWLA